MARMIAGTSCSTSTTPRSPTDRSPVLVVLPTHRGGPAVEPSCFSVTGGQEPACCGEVSKVLVGFEVGTEPASGIALLIDNGGDHGRIELAPN